MCGYGAEGVAFVVDEDGAFSCEVDDALRGDDEQLGVRVDEAEEASAVGAVAGRAFLHEHVDVHWRVPYSGWPLRTHACCEPRQQPHGTRIVSLAAMRFATRHCCHGVAFDADDG